MSTTHEDKGLFWNSQGGDRKYDAESMEKWISPFFNNGVYGGSCEVTTDEGLVVTMESGRAYINGKLREFEDDISFEVELPDALSPRIDAVVIERNDNDREITAKVVVGVPSATPEAPEPVRTGGIYQLVVAHISVPAAATAVTVTDTRANNDLCGYVMPLESKITWGTTPMTPGVTPLETGTLYFVYEEG